MNVLTYKRQPFCAEMRSHSGMDEDLGQLIRRLMDERDITVGKLAARAQRDPDTIRRLRSGGGTYRRTALQVFDALASYKRIADDDIELFAALSGVPRAALVNVNPPPPGEVDAMSIAHDLVQDLIDIHGKDRVVGMLEGILAQSRMTSSGSADAAPRSLRVHHPPMPHKSLDATVETIVEYSDDESSQTDDSMHGKETG